MKRVVRKMPVHCHFTVVFKYLNVRGLTKAKQQDIDQVYLEKEPRYL